MARGAGRPHRNKPSNLRWIQWLSIPERGAVGWHVPGSGIPVEWGPPRAPEGIQSSEDSGQVLPQSNNLGCPELSDLNTPGARNLPEAPSHSACWTRARAVGRHRLPRILLFLGLAWLVQASRIRPRHRRWKKRRARSANSAASGSSTRGRFFFWFWQGCRPLWRRCHAVVVPAPRSRQRSGRSLHQPASPIPRSRNMFASSRHPGAGWHPACAGALVRDPHGARRARCLAGP